MNKTKISIVLAGLLTSFTTMVNAEEINMEELDKISEGIEDTSIDSLMLNLDALNDSVTTEVSIDDFDLDTSKVEAAKKAAKTQDVVEEVKPVKILEEIKPVIEDDELVLENTSMETPDDLFLTDYEDTSENVIATNPEDLVFLRYIPEGTRITVNETFKVLPKKKYIILHNGKRVLTTPQTKVDPEKTFCYIELKPSGKARVLREGRQFVVTGNRVTVNDDVVNKSYGKFTLRTQKVDFRVDNPNVKSLSCISAKYFGEGDDAPTPLLIGDLKEQSGGVFGIEYPAYEEI